MSSSPWSEAVLDLLVDLELDHARGELTVWSSRSMRASPASATARQWSSSRITGSSPIFVQLP